MDLVMELSFQFWWELQEGKCPCGNILDEKRVYYDGVEQKLFCEECGNKKVEAY